MSIKCSSSGIDPLTGWKMRCDSPATKRITVTSKYKVSTRNLCSKHAKILRNKLRYEAKHCFKDKTFDQIDLNPES